MSKGKGIRYYYGRESHVHAYSPAARVLFEEAQNWDLPAELYVHQNTMYWVNLMLVSRKGLTLYQTKSNAIIFHDTIPSYCVEKVVTMKSGEIFTTKSTSLHAHRKGSS